MITAPLTANADPEVVYVEVEQPTLSPAQVIWLARLMDCESGINPRAINPVDRDGTPSHGLLQFKPSTFDSFTAKYGIEGELMDENAQVAIVIKWVLTPGEVDWYQQFPACTQKLGTPPK